MSYDNFDYNEALDSIKANLFDIYEHQERVIGSLTDEVSKQTQINNYVKMKDTAINLIEEIMGLYNNKKIDNDLEEVKPQVIEVNPKVISNETPVIVEENVEVNDLDKEDIEHFYLDDRNGTTPNFAYVPPNLLETIKKNGTTKLEITSNDSEEKIEDNHLYKIDLDKAKGIIVRTDQYMKLALSRHRQEGVLKEAKQYREEQARVSNQQILKDDLDKMNNKIKTLKVA